MKNCAFLKYGNIVELIDFVEHSNNFSKMNIKTTIISNKTETTIFSNDIDIIQLKHKYRNLFLISSTFIISQQNS